MLFVLCNADYRANQLTLCFSSDYVSLLMFPLKLVAFKYFENTGTATAPYYSEKADDFNPFHTITDIGDRLKPAFFDANGDGLDDLFVGTQLEGFKYYENTGSAASPVWTRRTGSEHPLNGFSPSEEGGLTLQFLDFNGDGLKDAIAGGYHTSSHAAPIHALLNVGTSSGAVFSQVTGSSNVGSWWAYGMHRL